MQAAGLSTPCWVDVVVGGQILSRKGLSTSQPSAQAPWLCQPVKLHLEMELSLVASKECTPGDSHLNLNVAYI